MTEVCWYIRSYIKLKMFGFCNLPLHNFLLLPLGSFKRMMLAHAVCVNPITIEMLYDKCNYVCDMHSATPKIVHSDK